jgi:putative membrane protein
MVSCVAAECGWIRWLAPLKSLLVFPGKVEQVAVSEIYRPMQPESKKLLRFLISWINNAVAVFLTALILRNHISYGDKLGNLLIASLMLGILNAFVRPILMLLALPLLIFTLGLFTFVINALLLCFLGVLLPFFHVDTFGYAFLGALIISVISAVLNGLTGTGRISVNHRRPPGPPDNSSGSGPVIDV